MKVEDKILNFLKVSGPSLPIRVAKNIKEDGLITAAYLSDLASQHKVKISKLKIGSSPLYYLPGHEAQLANFTDGFNPKDIAVFKRLQQEKVIRENDQELLTKVALRNLKDFAIPLHVTSHTGKEIFWKYYLTADNETNEIINLLLGGTPTPEKEPEQHVSQTQEAPIHTTEPEPIAQVQQTIEKRTSDEEQSYPPNTTVQEQEEQTPSYPPNTTQEAPAVEQKPIEAQKPAVEQAPTQDVQKELSKEERKPPVVEEKPKAKKQEKQKSLVTKLKEKIVGKKKRPSDEVFLPIIETFFTELDIEIIEHEVVRKNSEMDFSLKIPSVVGRLNYYCKAKSKNRCDEKDLSAAYMQAQITKRPLLFLYTGALSKKAEEMLASGAFENAIVKRLEQDGS